jgi:hypothetical protein
MDGIYAASVVDGATVLEREIAYSGNIEVACKLQGGVFIGGYAHGFDKQITYPNLLLDGVRVSVASGPLVPAKTVDFFTYSQISLPYPGPWAKRYTRYRFEDGALTLTTVLTDIVDEARFEAIYLAMLPMWRDDSAGVITHSGFRSPSFAVEDMSGAFPEVTTKSEVMKIWGDVYSGEVEVLGGWDKPNRNSRFGDKGNRNKLYFDFTGPYTPTIGETITARSRMRVSKIGA